ncbi:glycosyltransferase family protein [Candidatus Altiarchaeota archaeon]
MRVLIFVCGEGLGHTTRCIPLGAKLAEAGHEVSYAAYGYSRKLIEDSVGSAYGIPQEVLLTGERGALNLPASIIKTLLNPAILSFPKVWGVISKVRPDIVVTDMYYLGFLAGKVRGIPTIMITNQSMMRSFFERHNILVRFIGRISEAFYVRIFEAADKIIIPDYPPPDTICQKNMRITPKMKEKTVYSGPLIREHSAQAVKRSSKGPSVLVMLGGFGYRKDVFMKLVATAGLDESISYTFVLGPSISREGLKGRDNITVCDFIKDPLPYIRSSDLVVTSGGHNTIMEALSVGIPILSFPDIHHFEQENNAKALQVQGLGLVGDYQDSPEDILAKIGSILTDPAFMENTSRLSASPHSRGGPDRLVETISSMK